ncbi:hypothetical protein TNCV_1221141 [Trichonephila clavipes]|nr:hypothetical protein TNCV_1221141 [Trichonephila clavipes]
MEEAFNGYGRKTTHQRQGVSISAAHRLDGTADVIVQLCFTGVTSPKPSNPLIISSIIAMDLIGDEFECYDLVISDTYVIPSRKLLLHLFTVVHSK